MRPFYLYRLDDVSGVSGTGIVAEGVQFSNGKCALTWLMPSVSVGVYDHMTDVQKVHGHNGKTLIIWCDGIEYSDSSLALEKRIEICDRGLL